MHPRDQFRDRSPFRLGVPARERSALGRGQWPAGTPGIARRGALQQHRASGIRRGCQDIARAPHGEPPEPAAPLVKALRKGIDGDRSHPAPDPCHRRAGRRQQQHQDRRPARPGAAAGRLVAREARPFRPRGDPRAAHARQGLGRLRHLHRHRTTSPATPRPRSSPRSARRRDCSPASPPWPASAARPTPSATSAASRSSSTPRKATGTSSATTRRSSSCATRCKFPDLNHAVKRDPRTNLRSADNNWDFWTLAAGGAAPDHHRHERPRHPAQPTATCTASAATPSASSTPTNERFWVKFHFRTQQGIKNLTDAEAEALVGKDRESHQRDLYESIESGDFPRWTLFIQVMPEKDAAKLPVQPLRPDQGLAAQATIR